MINYGDITKIDGHTVPPVDVVIGGSPCQDLSAAGQRKGLAGQRSGLFMDQIRIVKEMRENDRTHGRTGVDVRPRFMVWENVCGAFSSNRGKDFLAVLEETARIADENAVIPEPPQGKWRNAGVIMGDGWSIAWRVHDAQFWGVPQRRRRISLVADFGGESAPEISFERRSLSGNPPEGGEARQNPAGEAEDSLAAAVANRTVCYGISSFESNAMKSDNPNSGIYEAETTRTLDANGGSPACNQRGMLVYDSRGNGDGETVPTMTGDHQNRVTDYTAIVLHESAGEYAESVSVALRNSDHKHPPVTWWDGSEAVQTLTRNLANQRMPDKGSLMAFVDFRNGKESGINGTLQAKESGGSSVNLNNTVRENQLVRRLTPLECERLQGFPDGWTDIGTWTDDKGRKRRTTDSNRYKALGNSIALPYWKHLVKKISAVYERDATMASLFDGIGGFPLLWEQINGKGSVKWISEIEPFCCALTERRFVWQ